jgi:ABC-type Mn2+/Zn2+ transport system ATPase subunit
MQPRLLVADELLEGVDGSGDAMVRTIRDARATWGAALLVTGSRPDALRTTVDRLAYLEEGTLRSS